MLQLQRYCNNSVLLYLQLKFLTYIFYHTLLIMHGAILLQTLPVEGDSGLLHGNYTYTMTVAELLERLREVNGLEKDVPVNVIGVGGTESLGSEVTYMGDKLYHITGKGNKIKTKEIDPRTRISFSQVALVPQKSEAQQYHFKKITAPRSDKKTHEINTGGAFAQLLKKIGDDTSKVVYITAKTRHIKTRAIRGIIPEKGHKLPTAIHLDNMIKGGTFLNENGSVVNISPQTVQDKHYKKPQEITMVGIVTGKDMLENIPLKGLHVHCQQGHVLDLGSLEDVTVHVFPIEQTLIRTMEKDSKGDAIWRNAMQKANLKTIGQERKQQATQQNGSWQDRVKQTSLSAEQTMTKG